MEETGKLLLASQHMSKILNSALEESRSSLAWVLAAAESTTTNSHRFAKSNLLMRMEKIRANCTSILDYQDSFC